MENKTIEEVADEKYPNIKYTFNGLDIAQYSRMAFIDGAKWQQEQSATEAIEFAEWLCESNYQYYESVGSWNLSGEIKDLKNTKELYEIWKQTK